MPYSELAYIAAQLMGPCLHVCTSALRACRTRADSSGLADDSHVLHLADAAGELLQHSVAVGNAEGELLDRTLVRCGAGCYMLQ